MSLSLPYPSLVFVPLDILTAEEQNQIVANYTYIANQFPVGASNINFASFGYKEVQFSPKDISVEEAWTPYDFYTGTISGLERNATYLILIGLGLLYYVDHVATDINTYIVKNDSSDSNLIAPSAYSMLTYGNSRPIIARLKTNNSDSFAYRIVTSGGANNNELHCDGGIMLAIRIG